MGVKHIHYNKEVKAQESFTHSINIIQIILGIRHEQKIQSLSQISISRTTLLLLLLLLLQLQESIAMNPHW